MLIQKYLVVIAMILLSQTCFSEETKTKCNRPDWQCRGSFYVSGGVIMSHLFFNDNTIRLLPAYSSTPLAAFPNNLVGVRFGFGDRIRQYARYTYEVNYIQLLAKTKSDQNVDVTRASKALSASLAYSLNPGKRLEVRGTTGAVIDSGSYRISGIVNGVQSPTNSIYFTDVFPFVGGSLTYHINSKCSLKLTELYQMIHYNLNASSAVVSILSMHYYPQKS